MTVKIAALCFCLFLIIAEIPIVFASWTSKKNKYTLDMIKIMIPILVVNILILVLLSNIMVDLIDPQFNNDRTEINKRINYGLAWFGLFNIVSRNLKVPFFNTKRFATWDYRIFQFAITMVLFYIIIGKIPDGEAMESLTITILMISVILDEHLVTKFKEARYLDKTPPNYHTKLQHLMTKHGYNNITLAEKTGLKCCEISVYASGDFDINQMRPTKLLRIAKALDCKMEDLLEPEESKRDEE